MKQIEDYIKLWIESNKIIKDVNQIKYLKIKEDFLFDDSIFREGNCFFRAISSFITWIEEYHLVFNKNVYKYILNKYNEIIDKFPYIYYKGKLIETKKNIPLSIKLAIMKENWNLI